MAGCPLFVTDNCFKKHTGFIIIRHQLGPDRPVSASSNSLFKGPPSRLRPFGPQFSINFAILLLFILVTCRSQFDLYLLSFSYSTSTYI